MVKDVAELIVANTNYGTSMQVQGKTTGILIQGRKICDLDSIGIN
jgi:hypothetical protein